MSIKEIREACVKYRIIGDTIQTVAIELSAGDGIMGRLGTLLFVKGAIKSNTNPEGVYWTSLAEVLTPQGEIPLVVYRCDSGNGLIGFQAPGPGRIHPVSLDGNNRVIVRRRSIVTATEGIQCDRLHLDGEESGEIEPHMFVTLSGSGQAFLHGPGNLVDFSIGPDEHMAVDGEMILSLEGEIDFSPKPVGTPGQSDPLPYILLMHLTGPGRIILFTMRGC